MKVNIWILDFARRSSQGLNISVLAWSRGEVVRTARVTALFVNYATVLYVSTLGDTIQMTALMCVAHNYLTIV